MHGTIRGQGEMFLLLPVCPYVLREGEQRQRETAPVFLWRSK